MRKKPLIPVSLIVSIFIHLAFIGTSYYWWVPGSQAVLENTTKMFDIQTAPEREAVVTVRDVLAGYTEKLKFERPSAEASDFLQEKIRQTTEIETPEAVVLPEEEKLEAEKSEKLEVKESWESVREVLEDSSRKVFDKDTTIAVDAFAAADGSPVGLITRPVGFSGHIPGKGQASTPFRTGLPSAPTSLLESPLELPPSKDPVKFEALDEFLNVRLATFQDPGEARGYFKVTIYPGKDIPESEVIPKEIIFLIDASLSIRKKRLEAFKKGIQHSLMHLNSGDVFNVYTFKERIDALSETSLPGNGASIQRAMTFLKEIRASERTDIYGAFLDTVKRKPALLPSYVILMSDGKPTYGVTSSAKLIGEITRSNAGKRSVFAFGGGKQVNRYLLDFLAYQNRGWSEFTSERELIAADVAALYDKIKNPILTGVRYQLGQSRASEVYPKHMPDVYRDSEFVIYGRFDVPEKFSMRILGQANDKDKEYIFVQDLAEAMPGSADIARGWAFSKIYDLISRMTMEGARDEWKHEIEELSRKYDIETPYQFKKMK